jgi:RNA polymerase sigma-70 factor (ECF subfamily)
MSALTVHEGNEWVVRACRGDADAFDEIVDKHYKGVYSHAYRILRNADDAADATQTTFVKAHKSLKEFDPSRPLKPWLYRICGNVCIDLARSRHRGDEELEKHAYALESDEDPQGSAEQVDLQRKIWRAVMHLPAKYRRIIVLRHYDQLDVEEIAETLGAPEGTIKSWLFRARALLRRELSGLFEPGQIEMAV